ncbi:MAG: GTP-binding protein [Rhodoferax sp.]|uniref:GTP-binding protein n=1 Tax=Rhodoferax sp. TaxID=50421 RepID=UPI002ACE4BAB|nr:ATP/GTP-binding protein [Rhodoferax sp.]MDZ7891564.1 GTP-binding protein [Rhodoferax sp.]
MREHKILITGTMGAGKTTAVTAISDSPPITTDVTNTDRSHSKAKTTVGLDFGTVQLDSGERLRVFGTPGQERFDFLWSVLATNALGIIILVDNSRPNPLQDLSTYLEGFSKELKTSPCVIGVGRTDTHTNPSIDDYADFLFQREQLIPILPVDVRQRADVLLLIDSLLMQVEAMD